MRKVLRHEELAAGVRYIKAITGRFYYHAPPSGYPPWYSPKYISDFSNISTVTPITLIYRRFDTTYRLTDNPRQAHSP